MKKIDKYIKKMSQVKLYYFEDEIYGVILRQSEKFILIRDIKDWHYDGYMIFPKKYISKIKYTKVEKFREKVMNESISKINNIQWLNLNTYDTLFSALMKNYNEICIEGASEEVNQFMIGKIAGYSKKSLAINKLDIYAKLSSKKIEIPIKEITCIYFKDEYSSKLFAYNTFSRKTAGKQGSVATLKIT